MLLSDMISIQTPNAKKPTNENDNVWNYLGQSGVDKEVKQIQPSEQRDRITSFDEIQREELERKNRLRKNSGQQATN